MRLLVINNAFTSFLTSSRNHASRKSHITQVTHPRNKTQKEKDCKSTEILRCHIIRKVLLLSIQSETQFNTCPVMLQVAVETIVCVCFDNIANVNVSILDLGKLSSCYLLLWEKSRFCSVNVMAWMMAMMTCFCGIVDLRTTPHRQKAVKKYFSCFKPW